MERLWLPLVAYFHPEDGEPTVVLAFQVPADTPQKLNLLSVCCAAPRLGEPLTPAFRLEGQRHMYIEFIPVPTGPEEDVRSARNGGPPKRSVRYRTLSVQVNVKRWNRRGERLLVINEHGVVTSIVDTCLARGRMRVESLPDTGAVLVSGFAWAGERP